jgi:hypothetical protein
MQQRLVAVGIGGTTTWWRNTNGTKREMVRARNIK